MLWLRRYEELIYLIDDELTPTADATAEIYNERIRMARAKGLGRNRICTSIEKPSYSTSANASSPSERHNRAWPGSRNREAQKGRRLV